MPTINVKVDDALKNRVWKEATKVPQRTVSDWAREVFEAALPSSKRKPTPPRTNKRGDGE